MTMDPGPAGAGPPEANANPPASWAAPPTAKQSGRGRAIIIIVAIVAVIGLILFVVRNNVDANDLKVGDCFVIPTTTSIQTVEKHPCNESHNAEVIFVGEHTGETYPIALSLDSFVEDNCVPAFATYVGTEIDAAGDLTIGYFYPSRDTWSGGDRTFTCYAANEDESPMTESVKGSAP